MFLKHNDHPEYTDLSMSVRDSTDWKIGNLREFEFPLDITSVTFDPVSRLLAIGTSAGLIHIRGGPGVESKLLLPEPVPVRFLQFGLLTERLVCLDNGNFMHIWDLSPLGCPKHLAVVRWDSVMFMTLSPSHNHIFLAMGSGELKTYDLACMRKSPYTLPNMWRAYEQQMLKSGLSPILSRDSGHQAIEILPHPRNLNLVFVAYEDGVVLLDLTERSTIRTYELVLPPGAPGGTGYGSRDVLMPRRSPITSIAIHPAGHFFAVGCTDGSIAFWAVDDANQPILVRTLEDLDVNLVDTDMLEIHLSNTTAGNHPSPREPIFKLAWSGFSNSKDPRGGETALTILGGLRPENGFGLTVLWLPAFNPEEPPVASPPVTQNCLHPFIVTAIRQSLAEKGSFVYSTSAPVQDFYLIPQSNPHFNYTYDPCAVLILVDAGHDERILESREFPPPSFISQKEQRPAQAKAVRTDEDGPVDDLDVTLESLSLTAHPQSVGLPFELCGSNFSADAYQMLNIPKELYPEYVKDFHSSSRKPRLRLLGGSALMDPPLEAKRKYQPYRILACASRDLTVSFYDISGQLLQEADDAPLKHDFPETIDALEIDLQPALDLIDGEQYPHEECSPARTIIATHLAIESMECAIALSTGELLVYRPRSAKVVQGTEEPRDRQLRLLRHAWVDPWRNLIPYFAFFGPEQVPIQTVSISEIGFLAVSFVDGSLFIVDMRGPTVIHRPTKSTRRSSRSSKFSFQHITETSMEAVGTACLTWVISRSDEDPKACVRLIAMQTSGNMEIYTITHSRSGFAVEDPVLSSRVISDPLRDGTFVISSKSGTLCKADRSRFADVLHFSNQESEPVVLVTAGAKGVRSFANITGERVGKADWSSKHGEVIRVQIVERLGSRVFVAYTNKSALHVYSLPQLEHIHTIPALSTPFRSISIDESGDFISLRVHPSSGLVQSATYGTLFNFRRTHGLPLVDLVSKKASIPAQPQPVPIGPSSYLSWFKFNQTLSGQQIDELLGGPDRPAPVKRARDILSQRDEEAAPRAGSVVASAAAVQSSIYNRLTSALNERGQMLGDLEENFKSLEQGSKDMVAQAKRLAAQNTTKSWFGL